MKKRISLISCLWLFVSCAVKAPQPPQQRNFPLRIAAYSGNGSEDTIHDVNLYVADNDGDMEDHTFFLTNGDNEKTVYLNIVKGQPYSVYLMANAGYDMGAMSRDALLDYKFYLRYPDSFDHGMPMSGMIEDFVFESDSTVLEIPLERLLAKICLKLDDSNLDNGVHMSIFSTRIGNCPRNVSPFSESSVQNSSDLFPTGYTCTFKDKMFTVFCLENCQYRLIENLSSYVEIDIDYISDSLESPPGRGLIYRFYLRENDDFCVRRNSIYNITVSPTGDGTVSDDSWRVDASSLKER